MSVQMGLPAGTRAPPPDEAELLIVGGGIMGLSLAYNAARMGQKGIVVLERSYLCSGASGRNGGGVRMQWSSEDNIELMQQSVDICRSFAADMGINVWFRQGGYLFLVRDEKLVSTLEDNVTLQNRCGVPTRMLVPSQIGELVPQLDLTGVLAASFNPQDGVLFPWPFLWGYAMRAIELGVSIHTFAEVEGLEMQNGTITQVNARSTWRDRHRSDATVVAPRSSDPAATDTTDASWQKSVRARHVVNATGAWAPALAQKVGLLLPNRPYRHEILTTEPLKPFLEPMVSILGEGMYFSQSMRGEIVGGMGDPNEPSSFDMSSSLPFLRRFAKTATGILPLLGNVQVVRQWAGLYDVSPDGRPVIGEPEGISNFTLLTGFTGHGFMMAPIIGRLCAERLVQGKKIVYFDDNGPDRFAEGIGENQESMIIG